MTGIPWGDLARDGGLFLSGGAFTGFWHWLSRRGKDRAHSLEAAEANAVQVQRDEIARLRADLDKLKADFEELRNEKHDLQNRLFAEQMENMLLRVEVNEELKVQGKPARYNLRASADEKVLQI